jgi:CHAT domain-containing protein
VVFSALPGVTEELQAIFNNRPNGGGVKGEVVMDGRFTRASFLDVTKRHYALVHIASHFSFRPGDDTQSFLLLGDGTALTLNEMKRQGQLFEGVELLTLSACDTAALRPDAMGREIDGFAESAQRLGAGAVMATLWTVADNSTPWLMREFYRARQRTSPLTKAAALQQAQLALLNGTPGTGTLRKPRERGAEIYIEKRDAPPFNADRNKPFAHPFYWAPFILIGNGR